MVIKGNITRCIIPIQGCTTQPVSDVNNVVYVCIILCMFCVNGRIKRDKDFHLNIPYDYIYK